MKAVAVSRYLCSRAAGQGKPAAPSPRSAAECPPGSPAAGWWRNTEPPCAPHTLGPCEEAHLLVESSGCPFRMETELSFLTLLILLNLGTTVCLKPRCSRCKWQIKMHFVDWIFRIERVLKHNPSALKHCPDTEGLFWWALWINI